MSQHYIRRSPDQWQQIIDEHALSGLSQERFCKDKDLSFSTFQSWRKKLGTPSSSQSGFVEIPRASTSEQRTLALDQGLHVRLELGAGVVLEISRV